jgi:Arc/MetJ-type ribon-helix-helix transcriptional regulator
MEKQNSRVGIRLPDEMRSKINALISNGSYKNLSEIVRTSLTEFLEKRAKKQLSEVST